MRHGHAVASVIGLATAGLTMMIGLDVLLRAPAAPPATKYLASIAIATGFLGLVTSLMTFDDQPDGRWIAPVATLAVAAVLLEIVPEPRELRLLGPAVGALVGLPFAIGLVLLKARLCRHLAQAVIGIAAITAALMILAREPFLEPGCAWNCGTNPWLLVPAPLLLTIFQVSLSVLMPVLVVGWCVAVRWGTGDTRPGWMAVGAALTTIGAVGLAARGFGIATSPLLVCVTAAQLLALTGLEGAYLLEQVTRARTRRHVRRLGVDLTAHGRLGHVEQWLRDTVHDPSLRLRFPAPGGGFSTGRDDSTQASANPRAGRSTTPVLRDDKVIAMVEHRSTSSARVSRALTAVVAMAIDNDRLYAVAVDQYETLVEARREVVRTSDEARRRLERDLHDGAQQRLLLLGMTLAGAADRGSMLDQTHCRDGVALAALALSELRTVANGTIPASLEHLGLVEAMQSLAEGAAIPVEVDADVERPAGRPRSMGAERTAYRVAASSVQEATRAGASSVMVQLTGHDDLRLVITHDGNAPLATFGEADRVGAARGDWSMTVERGLTTVRVVLPCA